MTNGPLVFEGKGNIVIIFRFRDHHRKLVGNGMMVSLGDTSDLEDGGHNERVWLVVLESGKMVQV
jgi:hypothetical protein